MNNNLSNDASQEAREQDYLTSGVFKEKTDAGDLHMFFSPRMVPADLTDDEVKLCLKLHARRKKISDRLSKKKKGEIEIDYQALEHERENLSLVFGEYAFSMTIEEIAALYSETRVAMYCPIPLPQELTRSPMTRDSFACGMKILVSHMDMLDR